MNDQDIRRVVMEMLREDVLYLGIENKPIYSNRGVRFGTERILKLCMYDEVVDAHIEIDSVTLSEEVE